ncbi:MAG: PAS domain S-box protein [Chloroflexia bacterium]|nr:PAS domain S-box protein [Chloroflexia bacterium]
MEKPNKNIIRSSGFINKIKNTNDRIINYVIAITLLFSIPAIVGMYIRSRNSSLESLFYPQFFLAFLLFAIYITRKRTSILFRVISYFAMVIIAMMPYALNVGVLGFWIIDLIIILVLFSVFTEKRFAYIALAISTCIVTIIAVLHVNGVLEIDFDAEKYVRSYNIWVAMIVIFVYVSILTISAISTQRTFFLNSIRDSIAAENEARQSEEKFKGIFNSSNDGIIISDIRGNIVEANESFGKILGMPTEEIKTKKTTDLVPEEFIDILKERIKIAYRGTQLPLIELIVKRENGNLVPVEINTILIDFDNEQMLLTIVRDITERVETERKILNSVIKAEERERSRFAKEIHDGVGPLLSAAKIYANAFKDVKTEEDKDFTVNKLNEIVNEAIISAKEISNKLSPHILKNFGIKGAIEAFFLKINQNNKIDFVFNSNIEQRLDEDVEVTLYRVVIELINNSLKYAQANTIYIELMGGDKVLSLVYSDDGVGFDVEKIDEKSQDGVIKYKKQNKII